MTPYPDEAVERAIALVRKMEADGRPPLEGPWQREARAIVALLPVPVDPDIAEVREVVRDAYGSLDIGSDWSPRAKAILDGGGENYWEARAVLAGIKRGRALERDSQ